MAWSLIAGYGVAVGTGLLAGLFIGAVVGLVVVPALLGGLRGGRPASGGWSRFGTGGLLTRPLSGGPDVELIHKHEREWQRVAGVDDGHLVCGLVAGPRLTFDADRGRA